MEKKNKIILAAIVAVAVIAIIVAAMVSSKPAEDSAIVNNNTATQTQSDATEAPKVTPTFVYFVSQKDAAYASFMATVDTLKAEYEGKVNFDLRDVDADPTTAENFAFVVGNTPALIMLNTSNDISAIELANPDEAKLRAAIEAALAE